jgi:hypothetical protein
MDEKSETFGFNAQDEKYVDMVNAGIVDPAKVVRTALQDAASIAGLLITTEAMVAELPKEAPAAPAMPGGGGMGGMGFQSPALVTKSERPGHTPGLFLLSDASERRASSPCAAAARHR